ncbi:hypothetical protein STEG23_017067, partial [Scotinomys teguina]
LHAECRVHLGQQGRHDSELFQLQFIQDLEQSSDHGDAPPSPKIAVNFCAKTFSQTFAAARLLIEFCSLYKDENLWIASRMVWFDQPRPPDSSQTAPVKIGASS